MKKQGGRKLAERQGFEPWVPLRVQQISNLSRSASLASLRLCFQGGGWGTKVANPSLVPWGKGSCNLAGFTLAVNWALLFSRHSLPGWRWEPKGGAGEKKTSVPWASGSWGSASGSEPPKPAGALTTLQPYPLLPAGSVSPPVAPFYQIGPISSVGQIAFSSPASEPATQPGQPARRCTKKCSGLAKGNPPSPCPKPCLDRPAAPCEAEPNQEGEAA